MRFTASFVEYMVNGCTALLWIALLIPGTLTEKIFDTWTAVLLIPVLYVVGLLVDYLSYLSLLPVKRRITNRALVKLGLKREPEGRKTSLPSKTMAISLFSSDLANELQIRVSRDRIARGALFNILILLLVVVLRPLPSWLEWDQLTMILILLALTPVTAGAWWHFEYLTKRYRHGSFETLRRFGHLEATIDADSEVMGED